MEKKNKRTLILSVIICLLPMVLGIAFYNRLPEQMPIHFTINDVPDNYAQKNFALFGIPVIMAIVQAICIICTTKVNKLKNSEKPRIVKIMEWFIPIITVLVYIIMIEVPLGSDVYVGKSVCLILGILFTIIGNYMPKMNYETGKKLFHPTPETKSQGLFHQIHKQVTFCCISLRSSLLILSSIVSLAFSLKWTRTI